MHLSIQISTSRSARFICIQSLCMTLIALLSFFWRRARQERQNSARATIHRFHNARVHHPSTYAATYPWSVTSFTSVTSTSCARFAKAATTRCLRPPGGHSSTINMIHWSDSNKIPFVSKSGSLNYYRAQTDDHMKRNRTCEASHKLHLSPDKPHMLGEFGH